jgi:S1-C subfamily serine protease
MLLFLLYLLWSLKLSFVTGSRWHLYSLKTALFKIPRAISSHLTTAGILLSIVSPLPHTALADSIQDTENQIINIFEKTTPSVVYINTFKKVNTFSLNVIEIPAGTGSGFVWDSNGHIVTNYHVIQNAQSAKIVLTLGKGLTKSYDAEVTGVDPDKDVAVLKIPSDRLLKPLDIGSSADLHVGQFVLAIGNPFSLDHSLSTGTNIDDIVIR